MNVGSTPVPSDGAVDQTVVWCWTYNSLPVSWEDKAPRPHETWWSSWGKPAAFLVLGIIGVVAAVLIALVVVGVLF
jgi:hypothetical protein